MNCERNICYQQDYNGGCDACPCNDKLQECKDENGQSMTTKEIIEQLKSLKNHCEDFREEGSVWSKDVEALDRAIEAVEKQIPNKPKVDDEMNFFECTACGGVIGYITDPTDHKYCLLCGAKLDWSDEE